MTTTKSRPRSESGGPRHSHWPYTSGVAGLIVLGAAAAMLSESRYALPAAFCAVYAGIALIAFGAAFRWSRQFVWRAELFLAAVVAITFAVRLLPDQAPLAIGLVLLAALAYAGFALVVWLLHWPERWFRLIDQEKPAPPLWGRLKWPVLVFVGAFLAMLAAKPPTYWEYNVAWLLVLGGALGIARRGWGRWKLRAVALAVLWVVVSGGVIEKTRPIWDHTGLDYERTIDAQRLSSTSWSPDRRADERAVAKPQLCFLYVEWTTYVSVWETRTWSR